MSSNPIIEKLVRNRDSNIKKLKSIKQNELLEVENNYITAKEIAIESNDYESIEILDEKLYQIKMAKVTSEIDPEATA